MVAVLIAALLVPGCAAPGRRLQYLVGDEATLEHYRDYATAIEYPIDPEPSAADPDLFREPRSLNSLKDIPPREITLQECIRLSLSNAKIIVEDQSFGSPANPLMSSPARVASVYDTAIQETGYLFGNRGAEAALADFDPIFTNSMQWGRSEDPQNSPNLGIASGQTLVDETAQWQARLEKSLANSGTVGVEHAWNYSQNNNTRLFPSAYTGYLQAEYRQPLLAGFGTEFTRIAGPLNQGLRGVSGVSQGVVISRINSDISILDFEQSVTNMIRDVETKYWDLHLAMQLYQSEIETLEDITYYRHVLSTRADAADAVSQAENRLYEAMARVQGSLADVLREEARLRRLLGLPLVDDTFLMPIDKPTEAQLMPDWESMMTEALANRTELRKQKWEVRSLELQLSAAKSLVRPRLDFVSQYRLNGFGDNLTGEEDDDGLTDAGYASAYESLTQGLNTTWNLGFSFSMPLGLRLARSQVRNYELRLRKAKAALAMQEREVMRELAEARNEMDRWYALAETGAKRAVVNDRFELAAATRVESEEVRDPSSIGRVLDAKISSRDADQGYLRSIVEYNKAITQLNYRKGTILAANAVSLAEGEWNPPAYEDARERGEAMSSGIDNTHLRTEPVEFVAGPGQNSWEARGNPNRPHVPGVVESTDGAVPVSPRSSVPDVPPAERETESKAGTSAPMTVPGSELDTKPEEPQRKSDDKEFDAVEGGPASFGTPGIRRVSFPGFEFKLNAESGDETGPESGGARKSSSKPGRARMSSTGKPGFE